MRELSASYSHLLCNSFPDSLLMENKERQLNIIALTISVFYIFLFVYLTLQKYAIFLIQQKKTL